MRRRSFPRLEVINAIEFPESGLRGGVKQVDSVFNVTKLLRDVSGWMLGLIPLAGGLGVAYHALMRQTAQEESAAAMHARGIRTVLTGTAIGEAAVAMVRFLSSYAGS